jgi:hypothetical protein
MKIRRFQAICVIGLLSAVGWLPVSDAQDRSAGLQMRSTQKEFLTLEPILVTVSLDDKSVPTLPTEVGGKSGLRFDIKPPVKPRPGAKPLVAEAKNQAKTRRVVDLLEWYQFPAEGTFTVQATYEDQRGLRTAAPVTVTIRRPTKEEGETGPVDRLHHMPWSNYVTDAFCGDTFDLVKQWPKSKLAKYSHYWSGLHLQHKKEYEKALASFRIVVEQYPDFVLVEHARLGIRECTTALAQAKTTPK